MLFSNKRQVVHHALPDASVSRPRAPSGRRSFRSRDLVRASALAQARPLLHKSSSLLRELHLKRILLYCTDLHFHYRYYYKKSDTFTTCHHEQRKIFPNGYSYLFHFFIYISQQATRSLCAFMPRFVDEAAFLHFLGVFFIYFFIFRKVRV
ncbi:hypothetical protein R5R35_011926 [Gryllus longicercus]|uniref:Uncharacterized protein n=1 Tax=Gryllus longicercus TaxID=2509291 RepID=A0AAN9WNZ0_9ORTH